MTRPSLFVGDREAHLWLAPVADTYANEDRRFWHTLLSPEETARHGRFHFEENKLEYLITRVLVRTVLAAYTGVAPAELRFRANPWGRPQLEHPELTPPLLFNLSNTRGLVACLITGSREGGVDVEDLTQDEGTIDLAEHYFAPSEIEALRALPAGERHERFFDYWTLKESYIKARGRGLSLPLDQFAFEIMPSTIQIRIDPRLEDDERSWAFWLLSPTGRHRLAVAVRGSGIELRTFDASLVRH